MWNNPNDLNEMAKFVRFVQKDRFEKRFEELKKFHKDDVALDILMDEMIEFRKREVERVRNAGLIAYLQDHGTRFTKKKKKKNR